MKVWPHAGSQYYVQSCVLGAGGRSWYQYCEVHLHTALWRYFSQVFNTWNCLLFLLLAVPGPFGDTGISADLFWSLRDGLLRKHSVLTTSASSVPILSSFLSVDSIGLFNQWAEFRELKTGARTKSYFIEDDTWVAGKEKEPVHTLPTLNIPLLPLWSQLTTLPLVHSVAATYADPDIIPGTFLHQAGSPQMKHSSPVIGFPALFDYPD